MLSVKNNIWEINKSDSKKNLLERVLNSRKLDKSFLKNKIFHDPFLFKDLEKTILKILEAIEKRERIMIFGDYDADGITASVILYKYLLELKANVSCRLPNRFDHGYGLRKDFYDECKKLDVKLVITTDCGISNFSQIEYGNSLGIDTIITDHHTPREKLPRAFSILNPKLKRDNYPFSELTGAGVVLKLVQGISTFLKFNKEKEDSIFRKSASFACIGTVADCATIIDENRSIVSVGLESLKNEDLSPWIGSLLEVAKVKRSQINSESIGFLLAPRINASGRMADPMLSFLMLMGNQDKASELEKLNSRRKGITNDIFNDIKKIVDTSKRVIIHSSKDYHEGIIGLIAGKISEEYFLPSIIMSEKKDSFVASCRSPEEFNLIEVLNKVQELFLSFGGHKSAAGFRIEKDKRQVFEERFSDICEKKISENPLTRKLKIDCEIEIDDINTENFDLLENLSPFGIGNEKPKFVVKNTEVFAAKKIGSNFDHLSFVAKKGNLIVPGVAFFWGQHSETISNGKQDLVFEIMSDEYMGGRKTKIKLVDARKSEE